MEFERSELPSMGWFGNRTPQEERGSVYVWTLPCGSLNLFSSDSSFPLIFLILRLGSKTAIWEDSRFGEAGNNKKNCLYNWGAVWFLF